MPWPPLSRSLTYTHKHTYTHGESEERNPIRAPIYCSSSASFSRRATFTGGDHGDGGCQETGRVWMASLARRTALLFLALLLPLSDLLFACLSRMACYRLQQQQQQQQEQLYRRGSNKQARPAHQIANTDEDDLDQRGKVGASSLFLGCFVCSLGATFLKWRHRRDGPDQCRLGAHISCRPVTGSRRSLQRP